MPLLDSFSIRLYTLRAEAEQDFAGTLRTLPESPYASVKNGFDFVMNG